MSKYGFYLKTLSLNEAINFKNEFIKKSMTKTEKKLKCKHQSSIRKLNKYFEHLCLSFNCSSSHNVLNSLFNLVRRWKSNSKLSLCIYPQTKNSFQRFWRPFYQKLNKSITCTLCLIMFKNLEEKRSIKTLSFWKEGFLKSTNLRLTHLLKSQLSYIEEGRIRSKNLEYLTIKINIVLIEQEDNFFCLPKRLSLPSLKHLGFELISLPIEKLFIAEIFMDICLREDSLTNNDDFENKVNEWKISKLKGFSLKLVNCDFKSTKFFERFLTNLANLREIEFFRIKLGSSELKYEVIEPVFYLIYSLKKISKLDFTMNNLPKMDLNDLEKMVSKCSKISNIKNFILNLAGWPALNDENLECIIKHLIHMESVCKLELKVGWENKKLAPCASIMRAKRLKIQSRYSYSENPPITTEGLIKVCQKLSLMKKLEDFTLRIEYNKLLNQSLLIGPIAIIKAHPSLKNLRIKLYETNLNAEVLKYHHHHLTKATIKITDFSAQECWIDFFGGESCMI